MRNLLSAHTTPVTTPTPQVQRVPKLAASRNNKPGTGGSIWFEDLVVLKELIEAGKVPPVIDRTYPLSETPEAVSRVGGGHARGKVAVTV